jgi:hypothetical protein
MFRQMYHQIKKKLAIRKILSWVGQFLQEKPNARVSRQWVKENSSFSSKEEKEKDSSSPIYIPLQLNYFFNSSNSSQELPKKKEDNWNLAAWLNLSQSLGNAYSPNLKR